jgi:hypothetical protein
LAVDDVGAGYATFHHILSLRPDIIKMDRSITQDIDSDTARRALATALVIFGGEIGATVIAEGIETPSEILALRRAGIHRGQGLALAPPAALPLAPPEYQPLAISTLLDIPSSSSEASPPPDDATAGVRAHGLLAAVDAIGAVLDMLNERLASIGEDRYRGVVGTAQRQARHVGSTLREMVRGFPDETMAPSGEVLTEVDEASAQSRARHQLRMVVCALRAANSQVENAVSLAREAGITWEEIARIMGMTRQGVSKRYGRGGRD